MEGLFRDTFFSHCLRFVTGGKVFKYPEEVDPSIWTKYVHAEKSANMARYGQTTAPEQSGKDSSIEQDSRQLPPNSRASSATEVDHEAVANSSHKRHLDPEKGKDHYIVDWYGPDDPEVRNDDSQLHAHPWYAVHLTFCRTRETGLDPRSSLSPLRSAF